MSDLYWESVAESVAIRWPFKSSPEVWSAVDAYRSQGAHETERLMATWPSRTREFEVFAHAVTQGYGA